MKEFDIKIAIHNHGPEDKHFPTPESALKVVEDRYPRMGLCIDVGHTTRTVRTYWNRFVERDLGSSIFTSRTCAT